MRAQFEPLRRSLFTPVCGAQQSVALQCDECAFDSVDGGHVNKKNVYGTIDGVQQCQLFIVTSETHSVK